VGRSGSAKLQRSCTGIRSDHGGRKDTAPTRRISATS
jgi:hypothetical protein